MEVKKYRIKKQWILTLKKSMEKQIPKNVVMNYITMNVVLLVTILWIIQNIMIIAHIVVND